MIWETLNICIMKQIKCITISILILTFVGCTTTYTAVSSYSDSTVDFTKYKTFAWLPDKLDTSNRPYKNESVRKNIRNYFGQCMSDRLYTIDRKSPDLLMQLVIKNSKMKSNSSYNSSSYAYSPPYLGSNDNSPYDDYYNDYAIYEYDYLNDPLYSSNSKEAYVNGAITLNFIDRKTKKLVWSGTARGDIYDPLEMYHDLHPVVHKILSKYPVKPILKRSHKIR